MTRDIAMMDDLGRAFNRWRYARGMGRRRSKRVEPERRLADIDRYAGMWIAVKDGKVVAAAASSRELVPMVRSKGPAAEGAVAQYVPERSDDIVIGVG
jgi:hypothetical protein